MQSRDTKNINFYLLIIISLSLLVLTSCSASIETTNTSITTTFTNNASIDIVDDTKDVTGISFSKYGNKYYFVGENFNPEGYYINVEYIDGDVKEYSLGTYPIVYEIKYNILCVSLKEFYINYQLVYGYDLDDWIKSTYKTYPLYYSYFEPYKLDDNFVIIYLSNEESLKNKTYTNDDFESLKCTAFEEITIERYKDIKLSSNSDTFYRCFKVYFDANDYEYVQRYLASITNDENSIIHWYRLFS